MCVYVLCFVFVDAFLAVAVVSWTMYFGQNNVFTVISKQSILKDLL